MPGNFWDTGKNYAFGKILGEAMEIYAQDYIISWEIYFANHVMHINFILKFYQKFSKQGMFPFQIFSLGSSQLTF